MVVNYMMIDGGGSSVLPTLADLPDVDTDPAALLDAADLMSSAGSRLRSQTEDAGSTWDTLPAVYTASGTDPLYSQLRPLVTRGDGMATAMTTASNALDEFATAVGGFRFEHTELTDRITSLQQRYYDADETDQLMMQTEIANLRLDVGSFAGRVETAEQACIDALEGIRGGFMTGVSRASTAASSGTTYVSALNAAVSVSVMDQLDSLAAMTPEEASAWLAAHPEFAGALETSPPPVEDVAEWWGSIEQNDGLVAALIAAMPSGIGNLSGVPYSVRSGANLMALDAAIAQAYQDIADAAPGVTPNIPSSEQVAAQQRLAALLAVADSLGGRFSYDLDSYQLVELHLLGEVPLAAVASGNLDTADYVSVIAPGMNSNVEDSLPGMVANGDSLAAAQQAALGDGSQVAVLSWMGYETPDMQSVFGNEHAIGGAPAFGETLAGLDGTLTGNGPDGSGPYTSVIMHSYGGTMGSLALSQGDYGVDNAIFLNSPGVIIDSADEMYVDNSWAATPVDDYVVDVGNLQNEHPNLPRREEFGAFWYEVPNTPGGLIGAHNLDHHFLDSDGDPYSADSEEAGGALAPLVDITLGIGENGDSVVAEDPDQWWDDHLGAPETEGPW